MLANLEEPDVKTLEIYADVLRKADRALLRDGLEVLEAVWANLRSLVAYGSWRTRGGEEEEAGLVGESEDEDMEEVGMKRGTSRQKKSDGRQGKPGTLDRQTVHEIVGLGKRVIGLWHRLIDTGGGDFRKREVREWQGKKRQLSVWLGRVEWGLRGKGGLRRER